MTATAMPKDPNSLRARVEAHVLALVVPTPTAQIVAAFPRDPKPSVMASISNLASQGKIGRYHHGSGLMHYGRKGLEWGDAVLDPESGVVIARAYAAPVQSAPVRVVAGSEAATIPPPAPPVAAVPKPATTPTHTHPGPLLMQRETTPHRPDVARAPAPAAEPIRITHPVEPPMSSVADTLIPKHRPDGSAIARTESERERDALRTLMASIISHLEVIPTPVRAAMREGLDVLGAAR